MKITISIEATPQEVREALGLPNVQEMQKVIMEQIAEKVKVGDMEVGQLVETLVPKSIQSLGKKLMDAALDSGKEKKTKD